MALKRKRKMPHQRPRLPIEHTGFYPYLQRFIETRTVRHYSQATLNRQENSLRRFIAWCDQRGLDGPQDITKPILERYQKHLYYHRQANGQPLSANSQSNYLSSIKQFFKWLTRENHLLYNPASELQLPRKPPSLPSVLTVEEVERLLQQPDPDTPAGLRDRAILELLYSTGIRRSELCSLQLPDLSLTRQTLFVRQGKGGKDRLLPVGQSAAAWLARYLGIARPQLDIDPHNRTLFLNDYGEAFRDNKLGDKVKRYIKNAGIDVPGSCHLLRHAMATHMLENGAELRFIQAMLGHADTRATQIYTHVSIRKLQQIHAATHPAKAEDKAELLSALAAEEAEEEP